MMPNVIILMGSKSDWPHVEKIVEGLEMFGLSHQICVASAHKTPNRLLAMLDVFEADPTPKVYITVAGRSNALSGMVDAQVVAPVIACPPYSSSFGGADVYSSIRMPSGVAPALVLEPINAALFAAKVLGRKDEIQAVQKANRDKLLADHESFNT